MSATELGMADEVLRRELDADEQLVWSGRPRPGRYALRALPIALFGVPWTAFVGFLIFAAAGGIGEHAPSGSARFFWLFGTPFALIGLAMLGAPFAAFRSARRTFYGVTTRRALVVSGGRRRSVVSYGKDRLRGVSRVERKDGSGDVVFETDVVTSRGRPLSTGFYGVPDVREVERLVRAHLFK